MLWAFLVKGCLQILLCCNHPMDQKCVGTSAALEYHLLHFYLLELPTQRNFKIQITMQIWYWWLSQFRIRCSQKTNHNHHTFTEQLCRDKYPKEIIQKGTTKKNCTNLCHKTLKCQYNLYFHQCAFLYTPSKSAVYDIIVLTEN